MITEDILKKTNLKVCKEENHLKELQLSGFKGDIFLTDSLFFIANDDGNYYLYKSMDIGKYCQIVVIRYLHELQNLLQLLGVKLTINDK